MQKIEAIIQPRKLAAVRGALEKLGISGLSVSDIDGYGSQKGQPEIYRGQEYVVSFTKKVKLEIFTTDDKVDAIVKTIMEAAQTGNIGDGKIFILPVSKGFRIRTGETGDDVV